MTLPLIINDVHDSQMFALAQAAGRAGIPVVGTSPVAAPWAEVSRYVDRLVELPDTNSVYAGFLLRTIERLNLSGVWMPAYEDMAEFTAIYRDVLKKQGLKLLSVDEAGYEAADVARLKEPMDGLKLPATWSVAWQALCDHADEFTYPCLLKVFRNDHVRLDNAEAMRRHAKTYATEHKPDEQLTVQQWIEGDVTRMATAMLLFDADSRPVRGFTGRRLRVAPARFGPFGETTAAQAEWIPELYEGACELMAALHWQGFAEVECKQGPDGSWYLIEINRRASGWMCAAEADGAGMLQAYYRICSEGVKLEECVLQRSNTRYMRMVGNDYHAPDWFVGSFPAGSRQKRFRHFLHAMLDYRKVPESICMGAWDRRDKRANREMLRLTWEALRTPLK
ncbi:MAG: hypothetical protein Q9M24_04790 [Mariprofundaceae bacterium]|nr:hypothetical protein [Mariprofundaceae bacterium]